jgi:hypothetical protein
MLGSFDDRRKRIFGVDRAGGDGAHAAAAIQIFGVAGTVYRAGPS